MNNLSRQELIVILAYYYFDGKKNVTKTMESFRSKYNQVFKRDFSGQVLMYYCSLYKNIDPSFNAKPIESDDLRISEVWNYYISQERIKDLKLIYQNFKKGLVEKEFVNLVNDKLENINDYISENISNLHFTFYGDEVKKLYESTNKNNTTLSIRDLNVCYNALVLANFKCEVDSSHETFMRKNVNRPYTEGHHIIPLRFQDKFDVNLDVEANVVSLCSNCHNKLHYGRDFEDVLIKIFTKDRQTRLKKSGIEITLEELISLYK